MITPWRMIQRSWIFQVLLNSQKGEKVTYTLCCLLLRIHAKKISHQWWIPRTWRVLIFNIFIINFNHIWFFLFFNFLFIYDSHTQREREREREAETQAEGEAGSMHREPDVGFDPGSPGSRPGPKAGAKPLRHPGIPIYDFFLRHKKYCEFFHQNL